MNVIITKLMDLNTKDPLKSWLEILMTLDLLFSHFK
jgi:hypothetical protein